MLWCFGSLALVPLVLAIASLSLHPFRSRRSLGCTARGCLASGFLLIAAVLIGLGVLFR